MRALPRLTLPAAIAALLVACSGDGSSPDPVADVRDDVAADADADAGDVGDAADTRPDVAPDVVDAPDTPTLSPSEVICTECDVSADCGGGGNLCLNFPDGSTYCGYSCTADASVCPEGTACIDVVDDGSVRQCVPSNLLCVDLCADVECDPGLVCDPALGTCVEPLGLCDECDSNAQCGGPNDLCLTFADADNRTGCGLDCTNDTAACPDSYFCAAVNTPTGPVRQCVPSTGTCVDRCVDVVCENPGDFCDPRTGRCNPPGTLCASCTSDLECGTAADRCVGLVGGPCTEDADCGALEFCDEPSGSCVGGFCAQDCSADPDICPDGSACYNLADGSQQCLPIRLTCVDRCAGVECREGFNCDDQTGECVRATLGACNGPCSNNAQCGGYDDLCLAIGDTGQQCYLACGDGLQPCPIGYDCLLVFNGASFCLPNNFDLTCNDCASTVCPSGQACYPHDTTCYPRPDACSFEARDCGDGALCNTFEERCEPIGAGCDYDNRFYACDLGILTCSATAEGRDGTCEQRCFGDTSCPADRARCANYHGVSGGICTSDPIGGAHTCGELQPTSTPLGRPCTVVDDPTDPTLCAGIVDYCLDGVDPSVPGFCTTDCVSDLDCPGSGRCAAFGGGRYCVPKECGCLVPIVTAEGEIDILGAVLSASGTSRCGMSWTTVDRRAGGAFVEVDDAYRLAGLGGALGDPLQGASLFSSQLDLIASERAIDGASARQALALAAAAYRATLPTPPAPAVLPDEPLYAALVALASELGDDPPSEAVRAELSALPDELEQALALLLFDFVPALDLHQSAFAGRDLASLQAFDAGLLGTVGAGETTLALQDPAVRSFLADPARRASLLAMADVLIAAIERWPASFTDELAGVTLDVPTSIGRIVVAGTGDDTHAPGGAPIALLVELGGDDVYTIPAGVNAGPDSPIGIVIDLGGADTYGYAPVADPDDAGLLPSDGAGRAEPVRLGDGPVTLSQSSRQGAGRLGFGALYDLGPGHDTFRSLRASQGFGMLGVGVLVDEGTADLELEAHGQGAGLFGVGILVAGDARHTYRAWHGAQGFGGVGGVGVLVGGAGDDRYLAEAGDPLDGSVLYYSGLTDTDRNLSAAQGAGVGLSTDRAPDGRSASGGLGVLLDLGGSDTYSAGVGAQGFAHVHGAGLLQDLSGDDGYDAHGLAHGSAIRYGVGVIRDLAGADAYGSAGHAAANSFGHGEDFGGGIFVDSAGADTYRGGAFAFGYGVLNGIGVFVDAAGSDTYASTSNDSFGRAVLTILGSEPRDNPRRQVGTWGFFVDGGGTDTYSRPDLLAPRIADGASWRQTSSTEAGLPTFGGGIDGQGATGLQ